MDTESESDYQSPREVDELDGFIVSDEERQEPETGEVNSDNDEPEINSGDQEVNEYPVKDRIRELSEAVKPNETFTQKMLRTHISVLVSAVGGPDYTANVSPPPYRLGHDALACLKDIKRWIKSVDERMQTYDVALACADSGLILNDLSVMLCQWDTQSSKLAPIRNAKTMEKIMLASLELLVLLTWPTELTPESTDSQRLSFSNLRKAQIVYKKHILQYNKGQTIKAVIRLVLQTMTKEKSDREPRDNAILRLVLFFIRNILYIGPISSSISMKTTKGITAMDNMPSNVTMEDISMNTVLACFKKNKVLMFLLTMSNSVGSEFDKEVFGASCLECIHLLIRNAQIGDLIDPATHSTTTRPASDKVAESQSHDPQPLSTTSGMQLTDLLKEETKRKKIQSQNLSTRHGRFGSLLSIQGDEQSYVISGQEALVNASLTLDKLDKSKKWRKPSSFKYDSDEFVKHEQLYLNSNSLLILKEFVDQFLVGDCFNNLIGNVSSLLSSADDLTAVDAYERAVYFLTIAWFLNYKRERNEFYKSHPDKLAQLTEDDDPVDFRSISSGLSQTNFILILNYFRTSFTTKQWSSLHVAMVCFLQLLLISHQLFVSQPKLVARPAEDSDNEENADELDKELGEGIIRNLFTSHDFLNVLVAVPQTASNHSPDYLKTCVYIIHILLKSFESFTKENVKLYIQKRRKKNKSKKTNNDMESRLNYRLGSTLDQSEDEEYDEETAKIEKTTRELDLIKTEARFFHTSTVSSYIDYLAEYEDLTSEEIKRCLSYFHRIFVVKKDYNGLFRLDFMYIIHKLRNYLPRSSRIRNHVDEFIVYFMKKFKQSFSRFPNPIEVLFPRFEGEEFRAYLSHGDVYEKSSESKSQPRLAKQIEFIKEFSLDEKVKILVTALYLQEKERFISWLISALDAIVKQRLLEVASGDTDTSRSITLKSPEQYRRLFINNPYIRLLLSLVKFELPDILEEDCELPGLVPSAKVVELLDSIKKWISQQPVTFEDGKDAFFFFRTKDTYGDDYGMDREYNGNDDGLGGFFDDNEEDGNIAFQTQGDQVKSHYMQELDKLDQLEALLSKSSNPTGVARKKRKPKPSKTSPRTVHRGPRTSKGPQPVEPERSSKSAEYIHDSDDDSDDEKELAFFAREEKLRRLLEESGGIVNHKQLEEFKKVWKRLANDSEKDIDVSISKVVENATENLRALEDDSQSQDPYNYLNQSQSQSQFLSLSQGESQKPESPSSNDQDQNTSTRLIFSSDSEDDENSTSGVDTSDEEETNKENKTPENSQQTSNPRKRQKVFSDDEDSDVDDITFVSATDQGPRPRKKAAIIDNDDDE